MKGPLLDAAAEACGVSKSHQSRSENRWWNEQVDEAIREKRAWFKAYSALKKGGMMAGGQRCQVHGKTSRLAGKIWGRERGVCHSIPDGDGVFRIAKQMDHTNQDVVGKNCVHNNAGELALANENKMKAWVEHYARLLNVEFQWPSNEIHEVPPIAGPPPIVYATLIHKALSNMKCSKPAGQVRIVAKMLNVAGEDGVELVRQLMQAVISCGVIPSDWEESFILNLYKGRGKAIDHYSCHGLKLTDQVMKLVEQVLDSYTHKMVNIDDMQFGFVPGRGTTDAIFIVRSCRRSASQVTNCTTLPSSTLKNPLCTKEGPMVGLREPRGRGMGCACHPGHVLQCPESCTDQWSVQ